MGGYVALQLLAAADNDDVVEVPAGTFPDSGTIRDRYRRVALTTPRTSRISTSARCSRERSSTSTVKRMRAR